MDPAQQPRGSARWSGSLSARRRWRPCGPRGGGRQTAVPADRFEALLGLTAGTRLLPGGHRVLARALRAPGRARPGRGDPRRTAVAGPPSPRPVRPSGLFVRWATSASLRRPAGREAGVPAHRQLGVAPLLSLIHISEPTRPY